MREQIETVIRDVLAPLFAKEGGTIELVDVRDGVVKLRLSGAYRGCPSSSFMVSGYVLPAFRQAVGNDVRVELLA
jgi:Fe-S cluster biogenesis protein NfuA